ncbi:MULTISPECIES: hypothetical protein [unclassified Nocardioides]|uniref:hypothetical protein n=1 Tax=unclassified Nocardioides TaxID=2615069 RepID=UPI0036088C9C
MTTTDPTSDAPGGRPQGTARLVVLGVLVLALLASAGCLVWLLAERRGAADEAQSAREAVQSQTEQFVLRLNTYGPDQLDDDGRLPAYLEQVSEVITPKFAADFEKSGLPIAEKMVTQAAYGRTVEVYGVGVESVGTDDATAIVAAGVTGSYPDPKDDSKRVQAEPDLLRWQVDLVRTDGEWLVDDYTPVSEVEQ